MLPKKVEDIKKNIAAKVSDEVYKGTVYKTSWGHCGFLLPCCFLLLL